MFTTLIVEDNSTFRQSLKEVLCDQFPDMCVVEASNGQETLSQFARFVPPLVFMDIRLPNGSGLDLTKKIKADHPETVVVILTSYDLPEYREAALRHGASHFLTKGSVTSDELAALVRSIASQAVPPSAP
jgi:DNA-binding NarL/FixJ family response regulator